MPDDGRLFANGYGSGQTFIFDMSDRARPRLHMQFGDLAGMMHPHSFLRLPGGNVLATFQMQHDSLGVAPGGQRGGPSSCRGGRTGGATTATSATAPP
jgi:hypothetical protein